MDKSAGWNHNVHYHDVILASLRAGSGTALDVGCGQGLLAQKLLNYCEQVVAIDAHRQTLASAKEHGRAESRITFLEADVMTYPFAEATFDVITVVATLHHLPLKRALTRLASLLKPGGVLAVVGLYRRHTLSDYIADLVGLPVSLALGLMHPTADVAAPIKAPQETLREIQTTSSALLPGSILTRRLLFRYTLVWQKSASQ